MKKIIKTTLLSVALIGANLLSLEASALAKGMEKCYGVVKSGQNDCATKTSSCAGSAKKDSQDDAFIAMPKGLCKKLVNGNLTSS
ncbi:MAG: DUF2282 domain-containing protein [Candidatus Thioglobus sp.]|nr:DUF2282 domain-containing protein [Candidatus Thioglobus sp.]